MATGILPTFHWRTSARARAQFLSGSLWAERGGCEVCAELNGKLRVARGKDRVEREAPPFAVLEYPPADGRRPRPAENLTAAGVVPAQPADPPVIAIVLGQGFHPGTER